MIRGMRSKEKLYDNLRLLADEFNHNVRGKLAVVSPDGELTFLGDKPLKPITVRALVPSKALDDEHGRRRIVDYTRAKYREINLEDVPATMRIRVYNSELSEIILEPLDMKIEYLENDDD